MTIIAPTRKNFDYDEYLERTLQAVDKKINLGDDDHLTLIVGETGSGKSNLALHLLEGYLGKRATTELIGLNKSSIAEAIKFAKDMEKPRAVLLDEANINKRDALSKFNKDIIDLYLAVRGLNIYHIWCNPSLDMIDKPFIEERIKGIYYCIKREGKARLYYYFRKKDILKIYNKYGNLKLPLIYKIRKKYGYYRGWFKAYNGFLHEDYLKLKDSRMDEKVEEFFHKYSKMDKKDLFTSGQIGKYLGVTSRTIRNYAKKLKEQGILQEGLNYFVLPSGDIRYKITTLDDFSNLKGFKNGE